MSRYLLTPCCWLALIASACAADTAENRRMTSGVPFSGGLTPNAVKDASWRVQVAGGYFLGSDFELYARYNGDLLDASGNSRNGTGSGSPTYVTGKISNAVNLTSAGSQYVRHGTIVGMDNITKFTWSYWVKPIGLSDFAFHLLKGAGVNTSRTMIGSAGSGAGDNNDVLFTVANGSNTYGYTTTSPLSTSAFTHVAMVYDGTQGTNATKLKGYINGSPVTLTFSGTIPTTTANNTSDNFDVGANPAGGQYGNVAIDDVRIYNVAKSDAEILSLYQLGAGSGSATASKVLQLFTP